MEFIVEMDPFILKKKILSPQNNIVKKYGIEYRITSVLQMHALIYHITITKSKPNTQSFLFLFYLTI